MKTAPTFTETWAYLKFGEMGKVCVKNKMRVFINVRMGMICFGLALGIMMRDEKSRGEIWIIITLLPFMYMNGLVPQFFENSRKRGWGSIKCIMIAILIHT